MRRSFVLPFAGKKRHGLKGQNLLVAKAEFANSLPLSPEICRLQKKVCIESPPDSFLNELSTASSPDEIFDRNDKPRHLLKRRIRLGLSRSFNRKASGWRSCRSRRGREFVEVKAGRDQDNTTSNTLAPRAGYCSAPGTRGG